MKILRSVFLIIIVAEIITVNFDSCAENNSSTSNDSEMHPTQSITLPSTADVSTQEYSAEFIDEYNKIIKSYHAVLQYEEKFYSNGGSSYYTPVENGFYYLNEFFDELYDRSGFFHVMDMDGDNIPEFILNLGPGDSLLLRYYENIVYGYSFPYRGLKSVKKDGTFEFSSGASDNGKGTLKFSADNCEYIEIYHSTGRGKENIIFVASEFPNQSLICSLTLKLKRKKRNGMSLMKPIY